MVRQLGEVTRRADSRGPNADESAASLAADKVLNLKRALCTLNLAIPVGTTIAAQLVADEMFPSGPTILVYLPLLGTISTLATVALLIMLARTRRDDVVAADGWTVARRIRYSLDGLSSILFVPYMYYWNMIGFHF